MWQQVCEGRKAHRPYHRLLRTQKSMQASTWPQCYTDSPSGKSQRITVALLQSLLQIWTQECTTRSQRAFLRFSILRSAPLLQRDLYRRLGEAAKKEWGTLFAVIRKETLSQGGPQTGIFRLSDLLAHFLLPLNRFQTILEQGISLEIGYNNMQAEDWFMGAEHV